MKKIAVIGGGISGLAASHQLLKLKNSKKNDFDFTLFERGSRLGHAIQSECVDGFVLEKGPDAFVSEKPWALDLVKELGLESRLISTSAQNRKSFILQKKRLVPLPAGFYLIAPTDLKTFFKTPLFSLSGKLRMIFELFVPKRDDRSDESVGSFIRRRFGVEALDRVGQAMIAGVYTGDPEKLSLSATMPKFQTLEREHGSVIRGLLKKKVSQSKTASGPRYSLFLSFKNGMQELTDALAKSIPSEKMKCNSKIISASFSEETKNWLIEFENGTTENFDAVIFTTPAFKTSDILRRGAIHCAQDQGVINHAPTIDLCNLLNQISYESVATLNFIYKKSQITHPLDGFGFVVPRIENSNLVACSFSSQKFPGRAPEGSVLLRAFVGGVFGHAVYAKPDADLRRSVEEELAQILGISGKPLKSDLNRYPGAMVQYALGHLERVSQIEQATGQLKGLYLTGSSYRGVGIPDCIHDAQLMAEQACNFKP